MWRVYGWLHEAVFASTPRHAQECVFVRGKTFSCETFFVPKDLSKNFTILKECRNLFDCHIDEMFFINAKKTLNVQ